MTQDADSAVWRSIVATFLEIVGLGAIVAGMWMVAPWLGLIGVGVALVLGGLSVDPPRGGRR